MNFHVDLEEFLAMSARLDVSELLFSWPNHDGEIEINYLDADLGCIGTDLLTGTPADTLRKQILDIADQHSPKPAPRIPYFVFEVVYTLFSQRTTLFCESNVNHAGHRVLWMRFRDFPLGLNPQKLDIADRHSWLQARKDAASLSHFKAADGPRRDRHSL